MLKHWLTGTRITYQAPDTPAEPVIEQPHGDPHGDEVLESGADIPLVQDPEALDHDPNNPPAKDQPEPDPAKVDQPVKPQTDWRDKELQRRKRRLDEEVTARQAAEAENKRLQDLVAAQQTPPPAEGEAPPPRQPAPDPERRFTQAEVKAEAARIAAEETFKRDFDGAYQAGAKLAGRAKMDDAISRISELGGLDYDHLQMVLATDDPGRVLYELGSKPEEFQRIMDLPFNRRVVEFTKMGLTKAETPVRKSNTPPPVEPIGGGGGPVDNRYSDKVDDEAWFRAEEKRAAEHHKRKNSW